MPTRSRRLTGHVLVALVYLGLGLIVVAQFAAHPGERVSGHLANDNTWFAWLLSHGEFSVRHLANPLFSVRQNYPTGVNMMANTSVLGVTLPLAPVTMLAGPWVTYLVWIVGACAGTAFAAYWVLRRHVVRSGVAAFLGGAAVGFAPGLVHHANGQPNFVSNFLLPFIVAGALRLGAGRRPVRDGVVLGLLVAYQVFLNEEMLLVTAFGCAVAVLAYAVLYPRAARARVPSFAAALAVAVAVAGLLCAYPLWYQFNGPGTFRSLPLYQTWGEDPVAYLTFARDTVFGDPNVEHGFVHSELDSWYGWPLTTVAVLAMVLLWRRSPAARVATVVAVVSAVLSLGPRLRLNGVQTRVPGPWHYIPDDLPLLGMLTPSRITFAVTGAFALLIALAWDALASYRPGTADRALDTPRRLRIPSPRTPQPDHTPAPSTHTVSASPADDHALRPGTHTVGPGGHDPSPGPRSAGTSLLDDHAAEAGGDTGRPDPAGRGTARPATGDRPSGTRSPGGRIAATAGMLVIAATMVTLIPRPLPAVDRPQPPVFITSGAWRPYVPPGRTLIPVPPPSKGAWGLDALGWGAQELDLTLPEGYFLGPGRDGYGHPGVDPPSTLTTLVIRTYWSHQTAKPTPAQRTAVRADLRAWHAAVIVQRAEPATDEAMKGLLVDLFGPPRRIQDVWLWPAP